MGEGVTDYLGQMGLDWWTCLDWVLAERICLRLEGCTFVDGVVCAWWESLGVEEAGVSFQSSSGKSRVFIDVISGGRMNVGEGVFDVG